jgi:hypothetical protein
MKQILTLLFLLASIAIHSQKSFDDFRKQTQQAYDTFREQTVKTYTNYRDSINAAYANHLEEAWKSFGLIRKDMGFKPMPKPPVYDPSSNPKPDDIPQQVPAKPVSPVKPPPVPTKPIQPPVPEPSPVAPTYPVSAEFFGAKIHLQDVAKQSKHLSGVSEKEVADYWKFLSKCSISEWTGDALRIKQELKLNDWGVYQLTGKLFKAYFSTGTENERIIFSVFLLNQLGYRAKIGRVDNELYTLIAFRNELYTLYFPFSDKGETINYYAMNPQHKNLSSIQTCGREYGNEGNTMDMSISQTPDLYDQIDTQRLEFENKTYTFEFSRNLVDYYATYPCMDFAIYAEAPLDKNMLESLRKELSPQLADKTQEQAVNFLLHLTQNAFSYKEDELNSGYEKWNFAEETLVSTFSDCDDRAIFFAQLVKNLLGMKVVLIHYPGRHLATAVKFDNPQTTGSYVNYNNTQYLICDPTYINADIGAAMPQLRNIPIEVIGVK